MNKKKNEEEYDDEFESLRLKDNGISRERAREREVLKWCWFGLVGCGCGYEAQGMDGFYNGLCWPLGFRVSQ